MSKQHTHQIVLNAASTIELNGAAGVNPLSIPVTNYVEWFIITGTATLANALTITASGAPTTSTVFKFLYSAVMDFDGHNFKIMDYVIPEAYETKEFLLVANYNGATWDVYFHPDFAGTAIVTAANLTDASITVGKMANLARGSVLIGDATNRPAAVDGSTINYLLVGDGNDLASVESTGDVIIDNTGNATIQADSVDNTMLANITAGYVKVGGVANAPTDVDMSGAGEITPKVSWELGTPILEVEK